MDKKGSVNFGENKSWVVPRNSWTQLAASFVDPSSSSLSLKTSSSTVVLCVQCLAFIKGWMFAKAVKAVKLTKQDHVKSYINQ